SGPGDLVRIFNTDAAVLEAQDVRKDLPCTVTPVLKPVLGFDLRFHAGYEVSIPLKDLAGSEDLLTMIFRVTPESHKDEPVYFSQRLSVPAIEENAKGNAYFQGGFDVGEGNYHVDFLMRERRIRKFSIVAFNMQEQRVVYRQENTDQISFPALGEALNSLNLGTVDLKRLSQKHGETAFLADLLKEEMSNSKEHPDAVIFA